MAGFGGSVKLTGASEYKQALNSITKDLKIVSAEMKATASSFASGDKSTEELTKDSEKYAKALEDEKKALSDMKNTLASAQDNYEKMQAEHKKLVSAYDDEKKKLDEIEKTLGKGSKEYKEQEKVVTDLAKAVDDSNKELVAEGKAIDDMRLKTAKAEVTINKTAEALDDLGDEAKKSGEDAEKGADGFTVMKGVLANLATEVINSAISGLKNLGAAFYDMGEQAVDSYAEFEQLEGGVKKLFGDETAKTVMENADKAFSTAGMSANEYMETVTGFSASLISSLDGDTVKAAEIADRAIGDMADNANTFGTSMESVQNAYQGFAKGNYTMLDNLKLGYGGTKEEMARLVEEASKMTDVQKELGVTIDGSDMSFANIANAISVVQKNMGIMGTTSKEASTTIEGSTASMRAAWQNMLTGIADENADFGQLAQNFIGTLVTEDGKGGVFGTMVPRIAQVITGVSEAIQTLLPQLIDTIVPIIDQNLPTIISALQGALKTILGVLPDVIPVITKFIPQIIKTLVSLLPEIVNAGVQLLEGLIKGITEALPELIAMLPEIIDTIVSTLLENLPLLIDTGMGLLMGLVDGLIQALPILIEMLPTIIETIVVTLLDHLPELIDAAMQIMLALITGLIDALPQLVEMVPKIIVTIVKTLIANLPQIIDTGKKILTNFINGMTSIFGKLKEAASQIWEKIKEEVSKIPDKMRQWGKDMIQGLVDGIRSMIGRVSEVAGDVARAISDFLHFSRPEKGELHYYEEWMPDFMKGMAQSLKDSAPMLISEVEGIANGISSAMTFDSTIGSGAIAGSVTFESMVDAFKEALYDVKIEMDDEEMGHFVDKTVSRLIYT